MNAWDGSVVDTTDGLVSVDTKNYRINFHGIEDPKTIEVNFTLSDLINYDKKPFGTPLESTGEDTVVLPTVSVKVLPSTVLMLSDSIHSGNNVLPDRSLQLLHLS